MQPLPFGPSDRNRTCGLLNPIQDTYTQYQRFEGCFVTNVLPTVSTAQHRTAYLLSLLNLKSVIGSSESITQFRAILRAVLNPPRMHLCRIVSGCRLCFLAYSSIDINIMCYLSLLFFVSRVKIVVITVAVTLL